MEANSKTNQGQEATLMRDTLNELYRNHLRAQRAQRRERQEHNKRIAEIVAAANRIAAYLAQQPRHLR